MTAQARPTVFVSYSHKDESWKKKLLPQLETLERAGRIQVWHDRNIDGGEKWYPEIEAAMARAAVTVCIISAHYLSSKFCVEEEIPVLLKRNKRDGMILIPLLLRPCPWEEFDWIEKTQMLPRDGKSVAIDFRGKSDVVFAELAALISKKFRKPAYMPPAPRPLWSPPEKVNTARLPETGADILGRRTELKMLDEAWESEGTHVVSLVAWGGVGKSTLVNKWLERMATDNYRGARRVYAWSFYRQGANERINSADLFINHALKWFGDPDPTAGFPWDKGARLARLVRREKTLLVLDGVEPLQSPQTGKVEDPALSTLLTELARENQGLCIVTTRENLTDFEGFGETVTNKDLEQISDVAGRALLRVGGVRGTDADLEQATRHFGNHALAVQLLAAYLNEIPGRHISNSSRIPDNNIPAEAGKHPRRMLDAFARRFGESPELELLRVLGLFNRPADPDSITAVRAAPPIHGLTAHSQKLSVREWGCVVENLRRVKLVARAGHHRPDDLDAHPLVRQHFEQQLKNDFPAAWREGNARLYEHLKRTTREFGEFPDTFESVNRLYTAIAHGCRAGRHQEALEEVYWHRIQRGEKAFALHVLGAFSADLAAMDNFFESHWRPVRTLQKEWKGSLLNNVGYVLRSLGRSEEAVRPMKDGLRFAIRQKRWRDAAQAANNLSEVYLLIGDIPRALTYARAGIRMASRGDDKLKRVITRATLADALFRAGRVEEAEVIMRQAERLQRALSPPLLTSTSGFRYCVLRLHRGKYREVQAYAAETLRLATRSRGLRDVALNYLSLGRAYMLQARRESTGGRRAANYLNRAVDGLRQAGTLHHQPRALLTRAELHRSNGDLELALVDLNEAMSIAARGSMRLYAADCHLEYARLHPAQEPNDVGKAREHLVKAREMIERMGYHLRDGAVRELEAELEEA